MLRVSLHQIDVTVGDLTGNEAQIRDGMGAAREAGAQIAVFPELAVTGYPPEDLLLRESFLNDAASVLERLAPHAEGIVAVVGFPERAEGVHNSAAVLADGALRAVYRKNLLPNYGVFDEQRYFRAGSAAGVIDVEGTRVGLTICEDVWRADGPAADEALAGAGVILNLSASPYHAGKGVERERMVAQRARDSLATFAFCNLVGGQDELVFDGHSFVVDHTGVVIARAPQFGEAMLVCDIDPQAALAAREEQARQPSATATATAETHSGREVGELGRFEVARQAATALGAATLHAASAPVADLIEPLEAEIYAALMLGLRDYVHANGFERVVLGLSGGIDSALVASVAVDALGPAGVGVAIMPSPHSSQATQDDARAMASRLGVETLELNIAAVMAAYERSLAAPFAGREPDLTEENLQARIRGNLLMALSNKFGWLVLTTGNKSEMSVGYTTLYGDSAGGFAVIKDCPKTLVYRLARHRNSVAVQAGQPEPILSSIIEREPSAELRPGQRDADSLPPYAVLDQILRGYVELDQGREELIGQGLSPADVDRVIGLVDLAEYKRRQAPPGVRITPRALGRDRRMPITNRYRG